MESKSRNRNRNRNLGSVSEPEPEPISWNRRYYWKPWSELHGRKTDGPKFAALGEAFDDVITTGNHGNDVAIYNSQDKQKITFKELDEKADKMARNIYGRIRRDGGYNKTGCNAILLAMPPSMERIVVILALWKLKLPYVPIEACVPTNRLKLIIREVRPLRVLVSKDMRKMFTKGDVTVEGVKEILEYEELQDEIHQDFQPFHGDLACILFTSGSTGTPKGVMLTHKNILHRLQWQWAMFPFHADDVGLAKTSLLFVDSISEIWSYLLKGRPLVVTANARDPEKLLKVITEFKVTKLVTVPSLVQSILSYIKLSTNGNSRDLSKLKMVVCSGEKLPKTLAIEFFNVFKGKTLLNFYGSTEVTGDATYCVYENMDQVNSQSNDTAMSIGQPIDDVSIKLTNQEGDDVADGEIGEINVRGPTVMKGYLNDKKMTEHSWFKTGDYATIKNGLLYFEGRHDDQVKIRGNRVSTMEIENVIKSTEKIDHVVVLVMEESAELVAFVAGKAPETEIKKLCQNSLPSYAIPKLILLDEIPLDGSTGKVDRVLLREMYDKTRAAGKSVTRDPEVDKFLTIVGRELSIGKDRLNLTQDFTSLGGNSVNVVHLAAELSENGFSDLVFNKFIHANTLQQMYDAAKNKTVAKKPKYKMVHADENSPKKFLCRLTAESFLTKDPFVIACGMTVDDFEFLTELYYEDGMNSNGNVIIKNCETGEMVGFVIMIDTSKYPTWEEHHVPEDKKSAGNDLLMEVLDETEVFHRAAKKPGDKVLEFFFLGVSTDLSVEDNLEVIHLAESYGVEFARKNGFDAIQASNTSPVTQATARSLGYQTNGELIVTEYTRPDGTKPFANGAKDNKILSQMKFLK